MSLVLLEYFDLLLSIILRFCLSSTLKKFLEHLSQSCSNLMLAGSLEPFDCLFSIC